MYVCMYVRTRVHAPPSLLRTYVCTDIRATLCPAPPSSVAFSDDSEHHVSDEESLPQELRDIMQKERQKKEKEEQEEKEEEGGPFPQTTLERRKKVQERKNLLSPKMPRRGEQPVSPTRAQATLQDEGEEVKRLTARVKELELVSVHRRTTHTHTHAHVYTPCTYVIM